MASLHSCCIPAAAATAPQHIVLPLAEPPLVAVCAANTNAAPSSSSSCLAWLGNPFGIPRNSATNPFPDLLNSRIFIRILFFRSKCVPANSEHVSSGSESSPAIDSSKFMNWKTFPPLVFFWPAMKIFSHVYLSRYLKIHNPVDVGIILGQGIQLTNS